MHAFPIRNDMDLGRAVALLDTLWDAAPGSPEADVREVMAELIERYEAAALSQVLPPPDPKVVITAKCRELGLSERKLGELLGWKSAGRINEVLKGKRQLTLAMVRDFERVLGIPPGVLLAGGGATSGVFVRLSPAVVEAAQRRGFGGYGSLDALVEGAVEAALTPPAVSVVVDAGVSLAGKAAQPPFDPRTTSSWSQGEAA